MNLRYIVADEIGHFASVFFDIMAKIYKGEKMASYNDKLIDSLATRIQLFLFWKSFDKEVIKTEDIANYIDEIEQFDITNDLANLYSNTYYQTKLKEKREISFNGKNAYVDNICKNIPSKTKIKELREKIAKTCTEFETKKFDYDDENKISWIGRVFLCKENEVEERPKDNKGRTMYPVAQFYLANLPYLPETLKKFEYITVFMGEDFPEYNEEDEGVSKNGDGWILRTYTKDDILFKNEYLRDDNICPDPYPLKSKLINDDFPIWDGGGLDFEIEDEICDLEEEYDEELDKEKNEEDILDYYSNIATNHSYLHKFGGYPSYCQPGLGLEAIKGYHFVFQISSDEVARYNIVDSGSLMFFYNENEDKWVMYYDFY